MGKRPGRRVLGLTGVVLAGVSMVMLIAGMAFADSGNPTSIHITSQSGKTVHVSGGWSWAEMATAKKLSYAGYAIDWGDVSSGNAVGSYHIGDGTAATNVVLQPTSPAQGSSGTWGPVSHTYTAAGEYTICVIIYDLGQVKPFKATGYHSLTAGGPSRNTDNSVDQKKDPAVACTKVTIEDSSSSPLESASPFESFQGATAAPTGTAEDPPSGGSSPLLPLLMLFGGSLSSALVLTQVKVRR